MIYQAFYDFFAFVLGESTINNNLELFNLFLFCFVVYFIIVFFFKPLKKLYYYLLGVKK